MYWYTKQFGHVNVSFINFETFLIHQPGLEYFPVPLFLNFASGILVTSILNHEILVLSSHPFFFILLILLCCNIIYLQETVLKTTGYFLCISRKLSSLFGLLLLFPDKSLYTHFSATVWPILNKTQMTKFPWYTTQEDTQSASEK